MSKYKGEKPYKPRMPYNKNLDTKVMDDTKYSRLKQVKEAVKEIDNFIFRREIEELGERLREKYGKNSTGSRSGNIPEGERNNQG